MTGGYFSLRNNNGGLLFYGGHIYSREVIFYCVRGKNIMLDVIRRRWGSRVEFIKLCAGVTSLQESITGVSLFYRIT